MCGRNDGPMRWAMEAIAAGVGGPDLATWTLAREDELQKAHDERKSLMRDFSQSLYPPRPDAP